MALLVKHSGDQHNSINKINLFNEVLGIFAGVLLIDQQVPYHSNFHHAVIGAEPSGPNLRNNKLLSPFLRISQPFYRQYCGTLCVLFVLAWFL